ncbi:MAG: RNA-binding domain-containing protein [Candidatus Bathyarchaeia archaeon]
MDEVNLYVEAEIHPTESEEKVRRAVENVFGKISMQVKPMPKGSLLIAEAKGQEALTKFYNLLRRERIRDAARGIFYEGMRGNAVNFCLNKQVAFAGHVSFSKETAESPLGPIKVRIECGNPRGLIDWLAPKTV